MVITMKERNSNIELLRIILAMGVIALHYNNPDMGGGLLYATGMNYYLLLFFENMSICAVDVFLIISGYYLCTSSRFSSLKAVRLLVQVIVMNLAAYGISLFLQIARGDELNTVVLLKGLFLAILPNNYYVILYIGVYLLARYINLIFAALAEKKALRRLLFLLLFLFSLEPTLVDLLSLLTKDSLAGLSMISISGSQSGYTIVNFLLMYCVGAYIRYVGIQHTDIKKSLTGYVLCVLVNVAVCLLRNVLQMDTTGIAWSYSNPFVIGEAAFLFLTFCNLSLGFVKPVNFFSASTFTVYLCHTWFVPYLGIERFAGGNTAVLLLHFLLSLLVIYGLCQIIFLVYSSVENRVIKGALSYQEKRRKN